MFDAELARLKADYSKLPLKDQEFALSLLNQLARKGQLSPKQWPWVKTLADRINPPADGTGPRNLGNLDALKAMFAKAGEKIKFPHLMLRLSAEENIKVWISGPQSKAPGAFSVATMATREWLGRVGTDGTWAPAAKRDAAGYAKVADLMCELIADPQTTLATHGKQLGACCYCNTELTDPRSVDVGYGKTCASNWGLPWGTPKQKAAA